MKKTFIIVVLFFTSLLTFGQVTDDFSDGDFTSSPVWIPDNLANWVIQNNKLRSNSSTVNATFSITTPSTKAVNVQWEFLVNLNLNTSSVNYVDVYLTSDLSNLTSASNKGYFLRIGGTPDEISLYKVTNGVSAILINGEDGLTTSSENTIRIKVTRDINNLWILQRDIVGGTNYVLEGTVTDNSFSGSNYFGILVRQSTASFFGKHFFDDFYVGDIILDTTPPTIQSVKVLSDTELMVSFNEAINLSSQNLINFNANNAIGNPSIAELQADQKSIKLTFNTPFPNGTENELTISSVQDIAGNVIVSTKRNFSFVTAIFNDIVINELFPDPSPQIGLPSQEFVEIFNKSNKILDLSGWKLSDPTTIAVLPAFQILPNDHIILTNSSGAISYTSSGKVIALSNFPTLNNDSDKIKLVNADGLKIDSVSYKVAWYQSDDKAEGGWTLERLNPQINTNDSINWRASEDLSGGTPGKQNSVFGKNPDAKPPLLLSLTVINDKELKLDFNEPLSSGATLITHYTSNNEMGNPSSVTLSGDLKSIQLLFEKSFANGFDYTLTVSGIQDLAGNTMSDALKSFRYMITAPSKRKDIIITEMMVDPSPVVQLPEAEYIELFNRTNTPFDLKDWKLSDATSIATLSSFILLPDEYVILTTNTNASKFSTYGKVLGVTSFPSLNNDGEPIIIRNSIGETIDSVYYSSKWYRADDKKDGGWSLELFNPNDFSSSENNWIASQDEHGGTPGKQNSVFGKNPDTKAPELLNLTVVNDHELMLEFNERLSLTSIQSSFYSISNEFGNPSTVSLLLDSSFIQLLFNKHFVNGVDYSLSLSEVSDRAGNLVVDLQKPFRYFISTPSKFKDIIISEIMADPSPIVQLPEAEYIELFNRTSAPFDLKDWKLTDATGTTPLTSFTILPNEYAILTSTSNAFKFLSYGKVLGVSRFPSLNNDGEPLVLKNELDQLIDSVRYSSMWYKDDDRSDGGWSLELIDPQNICGEEGNWISGEDEKGGTPGKQNSVFANKPDLIGPKLTSAVAQPEKIILSFDEKLEREISITSFIISPDISISKVSFTDLSLRQIQLGLSSSLTTRTPYQIEIKNLHDCAGNSIQEDFDQLTFALPEAADSLDFVINEILFNPKPGSVDFVEIYNRSPKYLNLKNFKLANYEDGEVTNEKVITTSDLIIEPGAYLAFTEDPLILKNNYHSGIERNFYTTDLPSFNDDEGSVVLIDDQNRVIDFLNYSEDYHSPLLKDNEGISLERISFTNPTNDHSNWRSATAMTGYATPGYLNSNARPEMVVDNGAIEIAPEIFSPSSGTNDFASIQYKFEQTGYIANVKIYDQQGRAIKEISNNEAIPEAGTFRWDGDRSDGTKARNGYYVVWFEVFDLDGKVKTYRKRVVLASSD